MSHSTCLVIGEDPETLLEPYDENTAVEPYRTYEEKATPQEHWAFMSLNQDHGLADDATWPALIEAYNARHDDERYFYDEEMDRIYTMSTYNPKSKWDWYQLGGRWTGFFKLKAGVLQSLVGSPGLFTGPAKPGWADQARKADIDFDGMRDQAEAEAISFHARCRMAMAGHPTPTKWSVVRDEMFPDDVKAAREFYHKQPALAALHDVDLFISDVVDHLCLDQEDPVGAYITRKRNEAVLPFAILDVDGWHEKAHMGWWAITSGENANWDVEASEIIENAPDNALFSLYDLHI